MEYVNYNGKMIQSYNLFHDGYLYYIPFLFSEAKAHKMLERQERSEQRWNWIEQNFGKLGIILAAVMFIGIVLLNVYL